MTLQQKLAKIQTEFKAKKSRFNSFGKYYFRSAEDILEATKPFLKELDVSVTIKEELISFDPPVMQVTARLNNGKEETGTGNIKNRWNNKALEDDNSFLAEQDKLEASEPEETQVNQ